jgi:hypothetical protein
MLCSQLAGAIVMSPEVAGACESAMSGTRRSWVRLASSKGASSQMTVT